MSEVGAVLNRDDVSMSRSKTGERRGLADKTIRNILGASLRAMLRDALDDGLIEADPLRTLSWPRIAFEVTCSP